MGDTHDMECLAERLDKFAQAMDITLDQIASNMQQTAWLSVSG